MNPSTTFRDPRLSLWQSSVAAVLRRDPDGGADAVHDHPIMQAANVAAGDFAAPGAQVHAPLPSVARTVEAAQVQECADVALRMVFTTDPAERERLREQIAVFGRCDPRWVDAVAEYEKNVRVLGEAVPYIAPTGPGDSVFNALPDRATIGFLADWGTGTESALALLGQMAAMRTPGVPFFLVHLGDIYYSGTAAEVARFRADCRDVLGPDVPVFTLAGNHDMYAGGGPYYALIAALNAPPWTQETSFFSLRNAHWQFQAMDTGLNDRDPLNADFDMTFLDPAEAAWHRQQLAASAGRKVVLLSHHQPFSAFTNIGDGTVNDRLLADLGGPSGLAPVVLWLWGHEHNMAFYGPHAGVSKGRCIGSGAIPVTVAEMPYRVMDPAIGFDPKAILDDDGAVYGHSFAVMEIDGPRGVVSYFQSPDPRGRNPLVVDKFGDA